MRIRTTACLPVVLLAAQGTSLAQSPYDLPLKNGHVVDPANQIDGVRDIAISGD